MSEENKIDRHEVRQCWGRIHHHIWEIDAGINLLRTMPYDDEKGGDTEYRRIVVCNGLKAASSRMLTDLDELQELLKISLPDWDEIKNNKSSEIWMLETINPTAKHAGNGA